jgi:hypothetical protein
MARFGPANRSEPAEGDVRRRKTRGRGPRHRDLLAGLLACSCGRWIRSDGRMGNSDRIAKLHPEPCAVSSGSDALAPGRPRDHALPLGTRRQHRGLDALGMVALTEELADARDHLRTVELDVGHQGFLGESSHPVLQIESVGAE